MASPLGPSKVSTSAASLLRDDARQANVKDPRSEVQILPSRTRGPGPGPGPYPVPVVAGYDGSSRPALLPSSVSISQKAAPPYGLAFTGLPFDPPTNGSQATRRPFHARDNPLVRSRRPVPSRPVPCCSPSAGEGEWRNERPRRTGSARRNQTPPHQTQRAHGTHGPRASPYRLEDPAAPVQ